MAGSQTKFTSTAWGGIVQGEGNKIAHRAVAIGGDNNSALEECTVVIGGARNVANGTSASIFGSGWSTSTGWLSVVAGGKNNAASGNSSAILGGRGNQTVGESSTVSGGENNVANGDFSSISGGFERSTTNMHNWAAGSLLENN